MKERATGRFYDNAVFTGSPPASACKRRASARPVSLFIAMAGVLGTCVSTAMADPPWWNSDWSYRKEIVIDHTQVDSDLVSFPVLVSHTSPDFDGDVQADGDDFVFTDDSGVPLDHEIELYDDGTFTLIAWANVPYLSSSVDTTLYMYYGNPDCGSQQNAAGTWDANYLGVYHLDENTGSTCYDSTVNANHGTYQGDLPTQILSTVGYGQDCDGDSDYIKIPEGCHTPLSGTVEMWTTQNDAGPTGYYYDRPASGGFIVLYCDGSKFWFYSESSLPGAWNIPGSANLASQKHLSVGWEEGAQNFRIDAISQGTASATSLQNFTYEKIYLGESHLAPHIGLDGMMDEVRLSNIKRTDAWTDASYRTMNDPNAFMAIGDEEGQENPDINCEDLTGHDFGEIPAGLCSLEHTWTVINDGDAQLTGTITLEGPHAAEFEFTQGGGAFALDPAEDLIVGVRFCPTAEGAKAATLHITSNDPDEDPCDLALDGTGGPIWWDSAWGYRKQITIAHTQVDDDLVSFPVLVSHTSSDFVDHVEQADGGDIAFTDDLGSKLSHEIELYENATGELIAWVNVPSLSSSVDTTLYVYYGNLVCPNQQNVEDTWDADYLAVWHMSDNVAGTAVDDSTSYANTANKVNTPTEATGKIGYCQDLERAETDHLQAITAISPIVAGTGQVTFEGWMNRDNMGEWHSLFYEWGTPGGTDNELGGIFASDANHYDKASISVCHGSSKSNLYSTSVVPAGEWTYVVGTYDSTTQRIYFNGSPENSKGLSAAMNNGADWYPLIGVKETYESPMNGMIDEVRISKAARSAGWIATSYNSMNDPASFMTIGPEEGQVPTGADINCEDLLGHDFGSACTGTCSSEHTWTVTNEGTDTLTGSIGLAGEDPDEFQFTQGDGAFALAPGESVIVGVEFCPLTLGSKSATLHITSNDPDENPCDLDLIGTGGCGDINCEDLSDYDWGIIPGECSDVSYWTIINEGDATLNGEVLLTGPDAAIFELTEGGGVFALEPAEELTVGVRFCCDTVGPKAATLHITSDDPDEDPCDKALSGTCQGFLIGGAVYSDLGNPLGSGEEGVLIAVDGAGGVFEATTSGTQGLWQIADVPPGTYSVDASKLGCTFEHVVGGVPGDPPPIEITADLYHQAENQSIQFLATCTPLEPDLNCEDLSGFDFGDVDVGESSDEHTWTLINEGTATLTGTTWLDGADPEQFEFTEGGGGFALEPDESRIVKVRFCPDSVGSKAALLHIVSNDPDENPCDKPLSGTGIGVPDVNCEDLTGYDYASIVIDLCSAEHTWLVENEGTATLSGTISLTGTDPDQFVFTQGDGPFDLDPSQTLTVGIRFCPDSTGNKSAELHIESNDPDEDPCDLALDGQGIPPNEPEINCEDLSGFDFGSKTVGFCTVEHTWNLINEGTAILTGDILLVGNNADEFEFTRGGGGFGLGPGAQRIIGVRFCPQTVGAKVATLEIDSNDADENPCLLALSGAGGECVASRDLAALWPSYCDGAAKLVEINLDVPSGATAVVLEDTLPVDWTASDISNGGLWDPHNNSVKWWFYDTFPDQVSYRAMPPLGTYGVHCFDGVISIDGGADDPICGDECVDGPDGAFIPADQPQPPCTGCGDCSCATCEDRQVEGCELSGYVCAWRSGCNDDMAGATRSAYIWTHGECYCWDGDDEMWYEVTCPPSTSGCCVGQGMEPGRDGGPADQQGRDGGSADRELPVSVSAGNWFLVVINVQPPPDVSVVALEDQPPVGWEVRNISNDGVWDAVHGKVKWGPYYAPSIPSQVSYELRPPIGTTGRHCFDGAVSFDGFNQPIDGDACVYVGTLGDVDYDDDLDLVDFVGLQQCFGQAPVLGDCAMFDFDGDDNIDMDDFDAWAQTMTGPSE